MRENRKQGEVKVDLLFDTVADVRTENFEMEELELALGENK